jgi:hypothetical protein
VDDGTSYFAKAVSYPHKMFMKLTTGAFTIKLFTVQIKPQCCKLVRLSLRMYNI